MVPKYIGWWLGTKSDGTGQIYGATLVHVQIWSTQNGGGGNCGRKDTVKSTGIESIQHTHSHAFIVVYVIISGFQEGSPWVARRPLKAHTTRHNATHPPRKLPFLIESERAEP